jgi:hypothetical protein
MSDDTKEASGFRFLFGDESAGRAVLEFETMTNPVRVSLYRSSWIGWPRRQRSPASS